MFVLKRIVLPQDRIEHVIDTLAAEVSADLEGRDPVFVGVLKGAVYFFTELTLRLTRPVEVDFMQLSSYGSGTESTGEVTLVKDVAIDIQGRDVYVVEDIVDTGTTLADLLSRLRARRPRSLHVVTLLSKPSRRRVEVTLDFVGVEIADRFVVGFGLDFAEQYRNLRDIWELDPSKEA